MPLPQIPFVTKLVGIVLGSLLYSANLQPTFADLSKVAMVDSSALRAELLNSATNDRLVRWYKGQVRVDDRWMPLEMAQQRALDDKSLTSYYELRAQATDDRAAHERLARWCAKQELPELANMHWLHVLRFAPKHQAALRELNLKWYDGLLVSLEEAHRYQERQREQRKQRKTWQVRVRRLRNELEDDDPRVMRAARKQLHAIRAPDAVPALLDEFFEPTKSEKTTLARRTELMSILGGIASPQAVETLAQVAVEATNEEIRYAAIDQLKTKPYESYVPVLLAGLAMPIVGDVSFREGYSNIIGSYTYSQEQPGGGETTKQRQSYDRVLGRRYQAVPIYRRGKYIAPRTVGGGTIKVPKIPGHGRGLVTYQVNGICSNGNPYTQTRQRWEYGDQYLKEVKLRSSTIPGYYEREFAGVSYVEDPNYAQRLRNALQRSQARASQAHLDLQRRNQVIKFQNDRIADVLAEVTGATRSSFPKSWWNWWSDYLEQNPGAATAGSRQQLNATLLNQQQRGLARGTWVWTRQGKKSVETVLPGDFVLSQDPRTGELAFKVVVAIAAPQHMTVSKVGTGDDELHCAPGHVVWVTGAGWQRVSKLSADQSLHGVTMESPITDVDIAFEIDSYDLIVDDFHTLFVGEQGVLVHDATPVNATYVALPGFSPAAVAEAAKLAAANR